MTAPAAPEGVLLVDKPSGPTSHDIVGRVRGILRTRRVGHAGTLDPMATGLLVVAVGRATKLLGHLALTTKSYTATIRLGVATSTDDAEGEPTGGADASAVTDEALTAAMAALTGEIMQVPSSVSAIKVGGRRAYDRVRAGEDVTLAARPVVVTGFAPTGAVRHSGAVADVEVAVDCSTGTYVRALARDIGEMLGVGAHLTALRRTAVGPFTVGAAIDLFPQGLSTPGEPRPPIDDGLREAVRSAVLDPSGVARRAFAVRTVTPAEVDDLRHGRSIAADGRTGVYACLDGAGALIALAEDRDTITRPVLGWQAAG